jgi:plasmid rolling circle replication initiator protein Rep
LKKTPVFTNDENEINGIFRKKRKKSLQLSEAYVRLSYPKRADKVKDCGTYLDFAHEIASDGHVSEHGKLHRANFCRDRFCPMCTWRRSFKYFATISKIMERAFPQYKFLFLTLTVPNPKGDDLSKVLNQMQHAWSELRKLKRWKDNIKGYIKTLEITYNNDKQSNAYDTYHPHFHLILAVSKSYADKKKHGQFIDQSEWQYLWQQCYIYDRIQSVDIRLVKANHNKMDEQRSEIDLLGAVCETAKYSVKDSDYLYPSKNTTDHVLAPLIPALNKRRLVSFGGCLNEIRKELGIEEDFEKLDLVHIDDDSVNGALAQMITRYEWQIGVYKLIDMYVTDPSQE